MDTDILETLDRRLDPLVPSGPGPVADLVRRGRARRARRRGLVAGVAAAVGVVAVVVPVMVPVSVSMSGGDDQPSTLESVVPPREPVPTTTPSDEPRLAASTRLVGFGDVAVAIPEDWVSCPVRTGLSFGPPGAGGGCDSPDGDLDLVTLNRYTSVPMGTTETVNALEVAINRGCGPAASCVNPVSYQVFVPGAGVVLLAGGSSEAAVGEIVSTLRAMPAGKTAVPPVVAGGSPGATCAAIAAAGLAVGASKPGTSYSCSAEFISKVETLSPAPGSVVQTGTRVDMVMRGAD